MVKSRFNQYTILFLGLMAILVNNTAIGQESFNQPDTP